MRVQAMSVGFMSIAAATPAITGYFRLEVPMLMGSVEWALLFMSALVRAMVVPPLQVVGATNDLLAISLGRPRPERSSDHLG